MSWNLCVQHSAVQEEQRGVKGPRLFFLISLFPTGKVNPKSRAGRFLFTVTITLSKCCQTKTVLLYVSVAAEKNLYMDQVDANVMEVGEAQCKNKVVSHEKMNKSTDKKLRKDQVTFSMHLFSSFSFSLGLCFTFGWKMFHRFLGEDIL